MKTRNSNALPLRRTAVALSILLALGACGSDDDDGGGTLDVGDGTDDGDDTDNGGVTDDAVEVSLSTEQEIPAPSGADGASGTGSVTLGEDGTLSGSITVADLTDRAQAAHIHSGFAGSTGPVWISLQGNEDGTLWTVPEDYELMNGATPELVAEAFERAQLYFNVHTEANMAGEIRGQIVPDTDGLTAFRVRIENVSDAMTLPTPGGPAAAVPVPLSPGAYIVHRSDANPLLEPRDAANTALEMVAEDGDPSEYPSVVPGSAAFDTGVGADMPGGIGPGGAFEFTVSGVPGDKLSLVTMFVESNDWFYTTTDDDDNSLSLFDDDGEPISGEQSGSLALWDAGTEQDEPAGTGPNQVMRQAAPNTGPDEGAPVSSFENAGDSVDLNGEVVRLTVTAQ